MNLLNLNEKYLAYQRHKDICSLNNKPIVTFLKFIENEIPQALYRKCYDNKLIDYKQIYKFIENM
jgi:hypothetical protein